MQLSPIGYLTSRGPGQTDRFGRQLGELLEPGMIIGLVGELGAGKTCFVRGLAAGLAVGAGVTVASPTFTLINEYPGRLTLFHIDLYRLAEPDELIEVGVLDCYRSGGVCVVEWFDRFPEDQPLEFLQISLQTRGERSRRLEVSGAGEQAVDLARAWLDKARR